MAENRDVEVTAAASPSRKDSAPSVAELRAATAQTRARIAMTVNAIERHVTTAITGTLSDGRTGAGGRASTGQQLATTAAAFGLVQPLIRRLGPHAQTAVRLTMFAALGIVFGLWIERQLKRPPSLT